MERDPTPPFLEAGLAHLPENVFVYHLLSDADQARLRDAVRWFIAEKFWEGCAGLEISDEIQVTIAGQACLLVLGFEDYCFEDIKTILVYPSGYLNIDSRGAEDRPAHFLGEAHKLGPVVLSWWHARWGGRHWYRKNIVLHEFAHKLAELGDRRTGTPPLGNRQLAERWERVMSAEYQQLVEDADYERPTLLDPYGASSRAEFFAVASECFFLQPLDLGQRHPALYELLADWYRQDPAAWRVDEAAAANARAAEEESRHQDLIECEAAFRRCPDSIALSNRISCWCALGEYQNALADCDQLIQMASKKEKADAYFGRGRVHFHTGAYEKAIADYEEAIRRRPDFAQAFSERGCTYASLEERTKAISDLTRALQLDPKDDNALLWRAGLHREAGKYDKALRDLDRAIRLCPHRPDGYRERGLVYLRTKNYDRAIADLSEAIRLDPDDVDTYRARADAFEAKGRTAEAKRDRAEAERTRMGSHET